MDSFDVIIIGCGGMGSSAAYHCSKQGLKTLAIEQFPLVHDRGSSHGETRMIRKAYFEHPDYVPLLKRAYENWAEIEKEVSAKLYYETGIVYGVEKKGVLANGVRESARQHGIPLDESASIRKKYSEYFHFNPEEEVFFEPEAGYLRVEDCVRAHLLVARKSGAKIQDNEKVLDFIKTSQGYVVTTNKGTYAAEQVIVSAGPWVTNFIPELKNKIKILRKTLWWYQAEKSRFVKPEAPSYFFEVNGSHFYGFPSLDEQTIKCAVHSGGEETLPDKVDRQIHVGEDKAANYSVSHRLKNVSDKSIKGKVCLYTMTPDSNFLIGRVNEGMWLLSPCSGHGFKFSSVVGEIAADFIKNGKTKLPVEFLNPNRFI